LGIATLSPNYILNVSLSLKLYIIFYNNLEELLMFLRAYLPERETAAYFAAGMLTSMRSYVRMGGQENTLLLGGLGLWVLYKVAPDGRLTQRTLNNIIAVVLGVTVGTFIASHAREAINYTMSSLRR
jgi:hypothetical protein